MPDMFGNPDNMNSDYAPWAGDRMNVQPAEQLDHDCDLIQVHSVWHTMQGEGPFVGTPAVFVRLAGCNLQCPFCDTEYTKQRTVMSPRGVVDVVKGIRQSGLVVLTGGEPLRQHISLLVLELLESSYLVQIETNGTVFRALPFDHVNLTIVCSPKMPKINEFLEPHIDALKYVVRAGEVDIDGLPKTTMGFASRVARPSHRFGGVVYVQPLDEGNPRANEANLKAALGSCMDFGYRLSVQTHKSLGLD